MKTDNPNDNMTEDNGTARRAKTLATIERMRPVSVTAQLIMLGFSFSMAIFVAWNRAPLDKAIGNATILFFPILLPAVAMLINSMLVNQRRLDALIDLVKQLDQREF